MTTFEHVSHLMPMWSGDSSRPWLPTQPYPVYDTSLVMVPHGSMWPPYPDPSSQPSTHPMPCYPSPCQDSVLTFEVGCLPVRDGQAPLVDNSQDRVMYYTSPDNTASSGISSISPSSECAPCFGYPRHYEPDGRLQQTIHYSPCDASLRPSWHSASVSAASSDTAMPCQESRVSISSSRSHTSISSCSSHPGNDEPTQHYHLRHPQQISYQQHQQGQQQPQLHDPTLFDAPPSPPSSLSLQTTTPKNIKRSRKHSADTERRHVCPICCHRSRRRHNLVEHIQTHDPNRPRKFICGVCSRAFARKYDMKRHEKIHFR